MPWEQKLKIALDAAKGIIYLHNHKRVHRHLTSHNILVRPSRKHTHTHTPTHADAARPDR